MSTTVELLGFAAICVGLGLLSVPAAIIVAGVAALIVGANL